MGEYATFRGQSVKIGTCENMYYLRFDQRNLVQPEDGSLDPASDVAHALRFRFPWPDEDTVEPGGAEFGTNGYQRAIRVPAATYTAPDGVEHYSVQFKADAGYLVSLPCPEGPSMHGLTIHRNGFNGAVLLVAQKWLADGRLVPVLRCGGCGAMWRCEEPADIEALAVAYRTEADTKERQGQHNGTGKADRVFYDAIADRILEGAGLALV